MAKTSHILRYSSLIGASITLVISFLMVVSHQSAKCTVAFGGGEQKACTSEQSFSCPAPAVEIHTSMAFALNFNVTCPWQTSTTIISYIAIILSMAFIVIEGLKIRSFKLVTLPVAGLISMLSLLVVFILMVFDIAIGHDNVKNSDMPGMGFEFNQVVFIINAILVALALIFVMVMTVNRYQKIHRKQNVHLYDDGPMIQRLDMDYDSRDSRFL